MHAVGIAAGMKFVLYPSSNHFILKSSIIRLSLLPFPSRFLSILIHSPASLPNCNSLIHTRTLPLSPFTHSSLPKSLSLSFYLHIPPLSLLTQSLPPLSLLTHTPSPPTLSPHPLTPLYIPNSLSPFSNYTQPLYPALSLPTHSPPLFPLNHPLFTHLLTTSFPIHSPPLSAFSHPPLSLYPYPLTPSLPTHSSPFLPAYSASLSPLTHTLSPYTITRLSLPTHSPPLSPLNHPPLSISTLTPHLSPNSLTYPLSPQLTLSFPTFSPPPYLLSPHSLTPFLPTHLPPLSPTLSSLSLTPLTHPPLSLSTYLLIPSLPTNPLSSTHLPLSPHSLTQSHSPSFSLPPLSPLTHPPPLSLIRLSSQLSLFPLTHPVSDHLLTRFLPPPLSLSTHSPAFSLLTHLLSPHSFTPSLLKSLSPLSHTPTSLSPFTHPPLPTSPLSPTHPPFSHSPLFSSLTHLSLNYLPPFSPSLSFSLFPLSLCNCTHLLLPLTHQSHSHHSLCERENEGEWSERVSESGK